MLTADRFLRSGKVRDLYALPDGHLLLVASDRISAFDVVLPTDIPDKGRVLTGLSRFWFAETRRHRARITFARSTVDDPDLRGRSMIVRAGRGHPVRGRRARVTWPGRAGRRTRRPGSCAGIRVAGRDCARATGCPSRSSRRPRRPRAGRTTRTSTSTRMVRAVGGPVAERGPDRGAAPVPRGIGDRRAVPASSLADTKFEFGRRSGTDELAPHRRGPDARFVAVLGRRAVRAGPAPGQLRQAVRPRLAPGPAAGTGRRPVRRCPRTSSHGTRAAICRGLSSASRARASTGISRRT